MSIEPNAQAHLRRDLGERLQNIDKQNAIDLYYELLSSGYSVREILSATNRARSNSERDNSKTVAPPRSGSENAATDLTSEIGLGGTAPANTQRTSDRNLPGDAEFRGPEQPQAAKSDVPVPRGPQAAEHPQHHEPGTDDREQLPAGVLSGSVLDIAGPEDAPISAGSKIAIRSNGEGRFRPGMFPGSAKRVVFAAFCTVTIACASIAGFALLHGRRHAEPATVAIQPDISNRADAPALPGSAAPAPSGSAASPEAPRIAATQTAKAVPGPGTAQTHPDKPANPANAASASAVGVGSEISAVASAASPAIPRANGMSPEAPRLTAAQTDALWRGATPFWLPVTWPPPGYFTNMRLRRGTLRRPCGLAARSTPRFLARARIGRVQGDLPSALYWYRRARDLGNSDAEILLKSMENTSAMRGVFRFDSYAHWSLPSASASVRPGSGGGGTGRSAQSFSGSQPRRGRAYNRPSRRCFGADGGGDRRYCR